MLELLFYSLVGGLFSLIGGLALVSKPELTKRFVVPLIAFGAGAFLAAAFLDILPEALESGAEAHSVLTAVIVGFLLFFIAERFIMQQFKSRIAHAEHSHHTESLPYLLIAGDSFHNFLDGILIALAFIANPLLGLPTALAIAAHEVPQEIGDFAILLRLGWKRKTVILVNIFQSLLTIPGVLVGYYLGHLVAGYLPLLMGGAAGIFIYIAASDLIPEINDHSEHHHFWRIVLPMVAAVVVVAGLSSLAHGQ